MNSNLMLDCVSRSSTDCTLKIRPTEVQIKILRAVEYMDKNCFVGGDFALVNAGRMSQMSTFDIFVAGFGNDFAIWSKSWHIKNLISQRVNELPFREKHPTLEVSTKHDILLSAIDRLVILQYASCETRVIVFAAPKAQSRVYHCKQPVYGMLYYLIHTENSMARVIITDMNRNNARMIILGDERIGLKELQLRYEILRRCKVRLDYLLYLKRSSLRSANVLPLVLHRHNVQLKMNRNLDMSTQVKRKLKETNWPISSLIGLTLDRIIPSLYPDSLRCTCRCLWDLEHDVLKRNRDLLEHSYEFLIEHYPLYGQSCYNVFGAKIEPLNKRFNSCGLCW